MQANWVSTRSSRRRWARIWLRRRSRRSLTEKGFLTSSCCPAFVDYIEKSFPDLKPYRVAQSLADGDDRQVSSKRTTPDVQKRSLSAPAPPRRWSSSARRFAPGSTTVITFEELQALFDSRDVDITALEEGVLDNASYYGRIFARCGGLADAIAEGLARSTGSDFFAEGRFLRRNRSLPRGVAEVVASNAARRQFRRGHGLRRRLHRRRRMPDARRKEQSRGRQVRPRRRMKRRSAARSARSFKKRKSENPLIGCFLIRRQLYEGIF